MRAEEHRRAVDPGRVNRRAKARRIHFQKGIGANARVVLSDAPTHVHFELLVRQPAHRQSTVGHVLVAVVAEGAAVADLEGLHVGTGVGAGVVETVDVAVVVFGGGREAGEQLVRHDGEVARTPGI